MKNPWLVFALTRVGLFVLVLVVLIVIGIDPIVSAMIAAVVGLAVSLIFLGRQRANVSKSVYDMVNRDKSKPSAENAEDQ